MDRLRQTQISVHKTDFFSSVRSHSVVSLSSISSCRLQTQRDGLIFIYDMTNSTYANFDYGLCEKILNLLKVSSLTSLWCTVFFVWNNSSGKKGSPGQSGTVSEVCLWYEFSPIKGGAPSIAVVGWLLVTGLNKLIVRSAILIQYTFCQIQRIVPPDPPAVYSLCAPKTMSVFLHGFGSVNWKQSGLYWAIHYSSQSTRGLNGSPKGSGVICLSVKVKYL